MESDSEVSLRNVSCCPSLMICHDALGVACIFKIRSNEESEYAW